MEVMHVALRDVKSTRRFCSSASEEVPAVNAIPEMVPTKVSRKEEKEIETGYI